MSFIPGLTASALDNDGNASAATPDYTMAYILQMAGFAVTMDVREQVKGCRQELTSLQESLTAKMDEMMEKMDENQRR